MKKVVKKAGVKQSQKKKAVKKPSKTSTRCLQNKTSKKKIATKTAVKKPVKSAKESMSNEAIIVRYGIDSEGHTLFSKVPVYKKMPAGWKTTPSASAPNGYVCIDNNKSCFGGERRTGFLKKDNK